MRLNHPNERYKNFHFWKIFFVKKILQFFQSKFFDIKFQGFFSLKINSIEKIPKIFYYKGLASTILFQRETVFFSVQIPVNNNRERFHKNKNDWKILIK